MAYAQEHNFDSYDEVENMHDKALLELRKSRGELDDAKEELRNVNEQIYLRKRSMPAIKKQRTRRKTALIIKQIL